MTEHDASYGLGAFTALFGDEQGVTHRTAEEQTAAVARDAVENEVDVFVRAHRGHDDPLFYRQSDPAHTRGSLVCVRCDDGVLATFAEFAAAAARQDVVIGPHGRIRG